MSKKNICFVANYEKTLLFDKVAKQLSEVNIYWVTVNKFIYNFLLKSYPKESILLIDKNAVLNQKATSFDSSKYKLNEIWYGDRVLKHEKWGQDYLNNLSKIYYNFIANNHISFVFGEQTWGHELLIHRICNLNNELSCSFLSPHTIRMPAGKFAFFKNEFQTEIIEYRSNSYVYEKYPLLEAKKPDYLALNDKILDEKSKISYFYNKTKYFFTERLKEAHDPTKPDSLYRAFKGFFSYYLNKKMYFWLVKELKITEIKNKDFVLFTLHKQPEASVDNTGRYYENQLEIIKNIWRILPKDTLLLVKEHSNAIGDRKVDFYNQISELKNTKFIHYQSDSYELIKKAKAVFTISGTIGYEAALMGTPSFTFIPIFFNGLSLSKHINYDTLRNPKTSLETLINSVKQDKISDQNFTNWIYGNSFEGIISDYKSNPKCMEKDNINKIAKAILKVTSI